jgi:hypothetical protein
MQACQRQWSRGSQGVRLQQQRRQLLPLSQLQHGADS